MSELSLSIIICTRNRVDWLCTAMDSVLQQDFDSQHYELLIVDGSSTDRTREMVISRSRQHPNVRYLSCSQPGLPRARVFGANHAQGQFIGYLDDDAKACSDWLSIAWTIAREHAPICFGGPFYPFYISPRPSWFRDEYGSVTHGNEPRWLRHDEFLCGGNIFFSREALRSVGGFDADFWQPGDRFAYGEEGVPQVRLRQKFPDQAFFYHPQLYILHLVRPDGLKLSQLARECFARGRSYVKLMGVNTRDPRVFPYVWRFALSYVRFWFKALVAVWLRDRRRFERPQNYVYESAFQELRGAGIFYQSILAIQKYKRGISALF